MRFRPRKSPPSTGRQRLESSRERPPAFSYYARRSDTAYNTGRAEPRDQDIRRRERLMRYWRSRVGLLIAAILILACVLNLLHLSPTPKVVALTSSTTGYFLQPTTVYTQAASKLFKSSIWNGNKITVNTTAIVTQLKAEFPELADVSVTLPLIGHRPIVYLAPTNPSLLLASGGQTYVIDNGGKVLIQAAQATGINSLNLPLVTDESGLQLATGRVALPSTSVSFIRTVAGELERQGVKIKSLVLPAAPYELDVHPSGAGYFVKFNLHDSGGARQQAGAYLAVRQRLSDQHITPHDYIDVRLDGRAYYK